MRNFQAPKEGSFLWLYDKVWRELQRTPRLTLQGLNDYYQYLLNEKEKELENIKKESEEKEKEINKLTSENDILVQKKEEVMNELKRHTKDKTKYEEEKKKIDEEGEKIIEENKTVESNTNTANKLHTAGSVANGVVGTGSTILTGLGIVGLFCGPVGWVVSGICLPTAVVTGGIAIGSAVALGNWKGKIKERLELCKKNIGESEMKMKESQRRVEENEEKVRNLEKDIENFKKDIENNSMNIEQLENEAELISDQKKNTDESLKELRKKIDMFDPFQKISVCLDFFNDGTHGSNSIPKLKIDQTISLDLLKKCLKECVSNANLLMWNEKNATEGYCIVELNDRELYYVFGKFEGKKIVFVSDIFIISF